jgi:hypothetical protein
LKVESLHVLHNRERAAAFGYISDKTKKGDSRKQTGAEINERRVQRRIEVGRQWERNLK